MKFIDTHTHLYLEEFLADQDQVITKALEAGVEHFILPNIDSSSWQPMLDLCKLYPGICIPMAGLHPTSVSRESVDAELALVEEQLNSGSFSAIGEIGMDLYWDKTFQKEQVEALKIQLKWAKKRKLPVAIHMRNSFNEIWEVLEPELSPDLTGVFHCFSGNFEQAQLVIQAGFFLGIGGVITFKNSGLQEVVRNVGTEHLLLETDAPYLAPVPFRGHRNEPSYIPVIASRVAEITGTRLQDVARVTTNNARKLFNLSIPEDNH